MLRIGISVALLVLEFVVSMPASAQSFDARFCGMVSGLEGAVVVSGTSAGTATRAAVEVSRTLEAGVYVAVVQLSAPATEAQLLPVARFQNESIRIAGNRIVVEIHLETASEVALRFRAPRGTRYRAGFYRVPIGPPGLGVRASAFVEERPPCLDCGPPPACVGPPNTMGFGRPAARD